MWGSRCRCESLWKYCRYFHFSEDCPPHSSTCSMSWSWLLCSVSPTCSCFAVSPQKDSLTPLLSSWPPASFHVVCLPSCKLGWAAGERNLPGERGQSPEGWERFGGALLPATYFQTCWGCCSYRLPLVQAPSLEFLISALVLTSQKLPLAIQTPGNCEHRTRARGKGGAGLSSEHAGVGGCRIEIGQW